MWLSSSCTESDGEGGGERERGKGVQRTILCGCVAVTLLRGGCAVPLQAFPAADTRSVQSVVIPVFAFHSELCVCVDMARDFTTFTLCDIEIECN